jgi:hypothetical protein
MFFPASMPEPRWAILSYLVTGESGTSAPTVTCLSYREITDFLDMFLGVICEKEGGGI